MFRFIKKAIAVCMIGFGLGMLFVLLLPLCGWQFIVGVAIVILGLVWLL